MTNQIVLDFFHVGILRVISRILMGFRGLLIVSSLVPYDLGEYTIWLLFVFYFSMLDMGVLNGLERDLPHYKGREDKAKLQEIANVGWSTFFLLSSLSSILLGFLTFFLFRNIQISLLLGGYLLTDKIFRAYESLSRIEFRYQDNGTVLFISAAVSLIFIWIFLPSLKIQGIFIGFITGSLFSLGYFFLRGFKLNFQWHFTLLKGLNYIKESLPLAFIIYAMELFHAIALTILAFQWDKETLGYFAFSYRIFQVCLAIFPYLIQEIIRTRLYYQAARSQKQEDDLKELFFLMRIYCVLSAFFWLSIYWWTDWGLQNFISVYKTSAISLKLFTLALLPLGIAKILTDYLCSRVHKKTILAVMIWIMGISLQAILLSLLPINKNNILYFVPAVYLLVTFIIYQWLGITAMRLRSNALISQLRLIYFLLPLAAAGLIIFIGRYFFHFSPSMNFTKNFSSFFVLCLLWVLIMGMIRMFAKSNRYMRKFYFNLAKLEG